MSYRIVEHTADIGIHVEASDLNGLLADAARGLFAIIVDNVDEIQPHHSVELQVSGTQPDFLLLDWLSELLMQFELEKLLFNRFEVVYDGRLLKGVAWGEPVDTSRHRLLHEVKAITYHGLQVTCGSEGCTADVIVDI
jgi:SHS2 domain-containing protein